MFISLVNCCVVMRSNLSLLAQPHKRLDVARVRQGSLRDRFILQPVLKPRPSRRNAVFYSLRLVVLGNLLLIRVEVVISFVPLC